MKPITVLLLFATTLTAAQQTWSNFNDIVADFPSCSQDCVSNGFRPVVDACGGADNMICICQDGQGKLSASEVVQAGLDVGGCVVKSCSTNSATESTDKLLGIAESCVQIVLGGGNGASTGSGTKTNSAAKENATAGAGTSHPMASWGIVGVVTAVVAIYGL